jgi:hypothetical protein
MRWPFRSKPAPPASFAVGPYRLDGAIEGLGGLLEFSPSEYAAMGRQFVGEKDYNALPVDFLGRSWDVMVQAVHGRICAIAPRDRAFAAAVRERGRVSLRSPRFASATGAA